MKQTLVMAVCALAVASVAYAQQQDVVEIEGGAGYVFGSGTEDPGPSLPTLVLAVVGWPTEHWGVAMRRVQGPGEDLYATPVEIPDRTFLGLGHVRYWTVTARHRGSISRDLGLELGFGMMFDERFDDIEMLREPPRRISGRNGPAWGFSLEGLVTHPLTRRFAVKAGVTYDFGVETNHLQPIALAAARF